MKVKGTVINSVKKFVQKEIGGDYNNWLAKLSPASRQIYEDTILATEWYAFQEGVIEPTRLIGEMYFDGDIRKAAWQSGKFSAKDALTGIYKVFVLIATPQYIMRRGGKIMASFYEPSTLVVNEKPKGVDVHITEFEDANEVVEFRIGGWMETALEMCGCKNLKTDITQSLSKGAELTEYKITWD